MTFSLFELADWVGPQWMLFYDDGSQGKSLGSVTLAFGQLADDGSRTYVDVTTYVKRRTPAPNLRQEPVFLNDICEKAQFVLAEREAAYAHPDQQAALTHDLLDALPWPLAGAPENWVPDGFQPSANLTVGGREVAAFSAAGARGWALCADLGDILVAVTGDGTSGGPIDLAEVLDLGPYPWRPPTASEHRQPIVGEATPARDGN